MKTGTVSVFLRIRVAVSQLRTSKRSLPQLMPHFNCRFYFLPLPLGLGGIVSLAQACLTTLRGHMARSTKEKVSFVVMQLVDLKA